jgi:RND family efflux transporter MFP subunit
MSTGPSTEPLVEASHRAEPAVSGPPPQNDALRDLQAFLMHLLRAQCALVGALGGAVFLASGAARKPGLVAQHQATEDAVPLLQPSVIARMERLAGELCIAEAEPGKTPGGRIDTVAVPRPGSGLYGEEVRQRLLAAPLCADGRVEGACVLAVRARPGAGDEEALRTLMLSTAQFEAYLWKQQALAEARRTLMLRETLELLDMSQQGQSAGTMGAIMCNELQRRFGCTRVSIGLVHRELIRLEAVTGADQIDRTAAAVQALEDVMEECASQDAEVVYPPLSEHEMDPAQRRVTRAHAELSRRFGPSAILSLPLRVEGALVGVVVLERDQADPFPAGAVPLLRLVAETIGPALWTRRLADRGVLAVTRDRLLDLGEALLGPRHTGVKLVALLLAAVFVLAAAVPVPSRVKASAEVQAKQTRTIVAPFTGYLESVSVKPGDRVAAGQVLATMDTTDLRLQIAETEARVESLTVQANEALQKLDNARARGIQSQVDEAAAQLALLREHLARAEIRSPIDGFIGRGELDAFIRARVDPTQPLFEVISSEHRAVAFIDEADAQRVREGMEGNLVIRARPGDKIPVKVVRINPAAEVVRSKNVYQAEVELAGGGAEWLRPGMTGTIKLNDGYSTTLAIVLRPVVDEVRMRMWW